MKKNDISGLKNNYFLKWHVGLIFALAFVLSAFNYTTYLPIYDDYNYDGPAELEAVVIRTVQKKKTSPPPPKIDLTKEIEEIEDVEFIEEKKPELVEAKIVAEEPQEEVVAAVAPKMKPAPKVVIVEEEEDEDDNEIYSTFAVDQMPRFDACEGEEMNLKEKNACAVKALMKFMRSQIKYPTIARENNVEGTAAIQFVVEKDGSISNIKVLHDPGAGLGAEAVRVIKLMPDWIPGVQKARKVKVRFNMPVKFKLG